MRHLIPVEIWRFLANFGDLAVLGPCAAAIAIVLAMQGRRREALAWTAGFLACFATTLAMKTVFGSFRVDVLGHIFNARGFPSGHTSLSTVFYGGIALLIWSAFRNWLGALAVLGLAALIALIGASVLALWWHHILDVAAGFLIGLASIGLMAWLGVGRPRRGIELAAVLGLAGLLFAALYGARFDDFVLPFKVVAASYAAP